MIKHCIIMSSSYQQGMRIALDILDRTLLNTKSIDTIVNGIKKECEWDAPLSMQFILAESSDWQSVEKCDPFFKGVKPYYDPSEFAQALKDDRCLIGLDVAKYILSIVPACTHLKLQKLTYLCYADYLCQTGHRLYEDTIYAFEYGPVVKSVYDIFKGSRYIGNDIDISPNVKEMPARSRILFSEYGFRKICSIDGTLKKYKSFLATQLVDLTHGNGKNTPWSMSYTGKPHEQITDFTILQYHCNE